MIGKENTSVYAQYTILCEQRETIQSVLKEKDIPSVSYYTVPLHMQPVFQNLGYKTGDFPVAERIADQCLSLPMSPYLSDGDQNKVIEGIRDSATSSSG
jgi:UDP-2-acetamido-2-deoxy-ribo-hexuluronate aminotransferase